MKLLRRLFNGRGVASRQRRNGQTRRSWISKGVEQLEGRRLMACMPQSDLALSSTSIDENLAAGTTVGAFSTTTPGLQAGNFTYAFEGGPDYLDNENFFLTGDVLKTRASLDFESISSYQVNIRSIDADGNAISKMFTIDVNDLQEAPVANDDALLTGEDAPVSGNVLANDVDDAGDVLSASLESEPANGTVELNDDGSFTYTPNADFIGTDTFTYTVTDDNGNTDIGTVTITVDPLNDSPVAGDDAYTGEEDSPLTGNVLVNDTDADGDSFSTELGEGPANGTVALNSDGSFTYTPNADYFGTDSFTYTVDDGKGGTATGTVSITISALNDAPEAVEDAFTTEEDTSVSGNVLTNDLDVDGDSLTVALGDEPTHGVVVLNADGTFTYTPNADYTGTDTFSYSVDDGNGGTATGTVTITVGAVNDGPVAGDDSFATDEDVPATGNVLANDTDSDGDSFTATLGEGPTNGSVILNADGSFTYTPNANYFGSDTFTYTVDDANGGTATGTVTITIGAVNDDPVAVDDAIVTDQDVGIVGNVLTNDSDVDGDTLTATLGEGPTNGVVELNADGSFNYTPSADFYGEDSFTYTVDDGAGGSATATVSITVNKKVDLPDAVDDSVVTNEDVPAIIPIDDLLANDVDREGNVPTFIAAGGAVNGTVTVSDGNVIFTPAPDFNGTGNFVYAIQDSEGGITFAMVTVTVNAVADAPVAMDDSATTAEGMPITIPASSLLSNDTDADGDSLSVIAVGGASNGTVVLEDGNVTFTPSEGFAGAATFHYIISDSNGEFGLGRVNVEVTEAVDANNLPVATADIIKGGDANELMIAVADLLANDFDADGDLLMLTGVDGAVGGTVSLSDTGISFIREANFSGVATFSYTINDGQGGTATGQVSVELDALDPDLPDVGEGDGDGDGGEDCDRGPGEGRGRGLGLGRGRGLGLGLGRKA